MKKRQARTTAEWVSLIISILLLSCLVGMIGWLWATEGDEPAQFSLAMGEVRQVGEQFYLEITVRNDGDQAAAAVEIVGSLDDQQSNVTLDLLPGHAEQNATLIFSSDPKQAELAVVGYSEP
ncbi:hypothetical protein [Herpetosiphon geysericola]|uniref:hypothetical protein n=1 Tax=Herpetosiphon geysericola TaxID=70996 RepID=UPI0006C93A04|nr:hypothetical protein [Herpetosiphon geysericola]